MITVRASVTFVFSTLPRLWQCKKAVGCSIKDDVWCSSLRSPKRKVVAYWHYSSRRGGFYYLQRRARDKSNLFSRDFRRIAQMSTLWSSLSGNPLLLVCGSMLVALMLFIDHSVPEAPPEPVLTASTLNQTFLAYVQWCLCPMRTVPTHSFNSLGTTTIDASKQKQGISLNC